MSTGWDLPLPWAFQKNLLDCNRLAGFSGSAVTVMSLPFPGLVFIFRGQAPHTGELTVHNGLTGQLLGMSRQEEPRPAIHTSPHLCQPTTLSQALHHQWRKGNRDWELFPASFLHLRTKWEVFLNCSLHSFAHLEISIYWEPTRCKVPCWGWKVTREYREGLCPGGADGLAGGSFSGASDPRACIFTIHSGLHTIPLP